MLALRAHGWTRNLPKENLVTTPKSDDAFEEAFRFVLPGYNLRPLELSGALGIEQVKKLPRLIAERRANADRLRNALGNHPHVMLQKEIGASSRSEEHTSELQSLMRISYAVFCLKNKT